MKSSLLLDHRGLPMRYETARTAPVRNRIRAKFDAAQTTDENTRHWANADALGPNSELQIGVRQTLRNRSRYECGNNTYASGMIRTLANDTIGTGPALQVTDPAVNKGDAKVIEDLFWEWTEAVRLPHKLRTMRSAKARDGETFGQFFSNPRSGNPVTLDFRPFETEMVSSSSFGFTVDSLLDGIILDDWGNVAAYRVLREHPGEALQEYSGQADITPAREIIHLAACDRPGQYRGCPEITPALPLYALLRRYTLAVTRSAESAALLSWIVESQGDPDFPVEAMDTLETERGMGLVLPRGSKMSQLKAEQPTGTYSEFKRNLIAEIARCLGMPYNVAAGDSSGYNYSSGRLDHRTYYKSLRVERAYIEIAALKPIFLNWWNEARLIPRYLPPAYYGSDVPAPVREWRWDGDEHVDPTKEADAMLSRVRGGFTSIDAEVAQLGGDVNVIHQKNADRLGLTLPEYQSRLADYFFGSPAATPAPTPPSDGATNE